MDASTANALIAAGSGVIVGLIPAGFLFVTNRHEANDRATARRDEIDERKTIREDEAEAKNKETEADKHRRLAEEKAARIAIVRSEVLDFLSSTRRVADLVLTTDSHMGIFTAQREDLEQVNRAAEAVLLRLANEPFTATRVEAVRLKLQELITTDGNKDVYHVDFTRSHAEAGHLLRDLLNTMETGTLA